MSRLAYSEEELLADPSFASRNRRDGILFHGGFDDGGSYLPPRSLHRIPAIRAWTDRLAAEGHPTEVIGLATEPGKGGASGIVSPGVELVRRPFFPSPDQSRLLLRHGAKDAITRILTMVGITEGFGNDGIRALPRPPLERYFREPIEGTCLEHLYRGLFEAHGNDEAGRGDEAGHDVMWYAIRDAALDHPNVTPDMFQNLPIAPPPGYTGPARPAPEAIGVSELTKTLFPTVDVLFEILVGALSQLLVIELMAFGTFAWAREVLADPESSAAPEWAPSMVEYVQADESIHVGYLQCALSEIRCRTVIDQNGRDVPGTELIDAICRKMVQAQTGSRWDRLLAYRMGQIRRELDARPDGAEILREFADLGPVPQ